MKKRIGWTTCPGQGDKHWVAALLEDGTTGDGLVAFGTKEEALQCVNSGEADRMAGHITDMKQRGRK